MRRRLSLAGNRYWAGSNRLHRPLFSRQARSFNVKEGGLQSSLSVKQTESSHKNNIGGEVLFPIALFGIVRKKEIELKDEMDEEDIKLRKLAELLKIPIEGEKLSDKKLREQCFVAIIKALKEVEIDVWEKLDKELLKACKLEDNNNRCIFQALLHDPTTSYTVFQEILRRDLLDALSNGVQPSILFEEAVQVRRLYMVDIFMEFCPPGESFSEVHRSIHQNNNVEKAFQEYQTLVAKKELDNSEMGMCLEKLGEALVKAERMWEGLPYLERALAIGEKVIGPDHPALETSLMNLAHCHIEMGQKNEGISYYKRALAIREKELGPDHLVLTCFLKGIALLAAEQGRLEEAMPYLKRIEGIIEKKFGRDHPEMAFVMLLYGAAMHAARKHEDARRYFIQSLIIRKKALGQDHPLVADSYSCVGTALHNLKRYDEALEFHKKALAIRSKLDGTEVPTSLVDIGVTLMAMGRMEEAMDYLEKGFAADEKALGPDHPSAIVKWCRIGLLLSGARWHDLAIPYFRQLLKLRMKTLGEDHPVTGKSMVNLGTCLCVAGYRSEGLPYLKQSLVIVEKDFGPDHPLTQQIKRSIGKHERIAQQEQDMPFLYAMLIRNEGTSSNTGKGK